MATVLLVLAVVAATIVAQRAVVALRPRLRRGRRVECDRCQETLPVARAVTIANTRPAPDSIPGLGGSAMVAHYHRRCARLEGIVDTTPDHRS